MEAQVKILNKNRKLINTYSIKGTPQEIFNKIQEARRTWDEYYVEIEAEMWNQSFSHTYKEELLNK